MTVDGRTYDSLEAATGYGSVDGLLGANCRHSFGPYLPGRTARDFYDMEIGSASIMRGYMAHPCDAELTLEKKLRLFLTMSLRAYNVPKEEVEQVIRFVEGLDIRAIAERVMHALFEALAMRFDFSLQGITETEEHK